MTFDGRFSCNAVHVFDLFEMRAWVRAETTAGRIPVTRPIRLEVLHPDREMDGSCRWCGCRENEVMTFDD